MRKQLASLLAAVAVTVLASAPARAADIYVLSNGIFSGGSIATNFGSIDIDTGVYTSIASLNGDVWNLAWNPEANNFFVTENFTVSSNLRTLTLSGTLSAQIGSTIGRTIYGMAYRDSVSPLYVANFSTDQFGTVSPTSGGYSNLGSSPGLDAPNGGRYAILNDTIYMALSGNRFGTVTYNGVYTPITSSNNLMSNMVLATDGTTLYGLFGDGNANQQKLYTVDPGTGNTTFLTNISGSGLGTIFHGAAMVPVPEPSTYILGGLATGVMAFVARRRKARGQG